jgi:hypothetical protein
MLRPPSAELPPEQQSLLHADFLANEQEYLRIRDSLLPGYLGQWVAIHNGGLVAAGADLMRVMEQAAATGGHPFVARVGYEDEVAFRVRRSTFAYDQGYLPFALPRIAVTFWNDQETHSQTYDDVIPDTGADLSVLPQADCASFNLFSSLCLTGLTAAVLGGSVRALVYFGRAEILGSRTPALIQADPRGQERLVGRDVLNQYRVLFDGPAGQVAFDP